MLVWRHCFCFIWVCLSEINNLVCLLLCILLSDFKLDQFNSCTSFTPSFSLSSLDSAFWCCCSHLIVYLGHTSTGWSKKVLVNPCCHIPFSNRSVSFTAFIIYSTASLYILYALFLLAFILLPLDAFVYLTLLPVFLVYPLLFFPCTEKGTTEGLEALSVALLQRQVIWAVCE